MTNLQKWMSVYGNNLPRPLSGKADKQWTEYSITVRLPEIGRRVVLENSFPPEIENRIHGLIKEIPYGQIRPINRDDCGDWEEWNSLIEPYIGQNWLEVPWLFVEFYFYRRILEAVDYFNSGKYFLVDPFHFQKTESFRVSLQSINDLLKWLNELRQEKETNKAILGKLLLYILESNRVDLSLWPVKEGVTRQQSARKSQNDYLMVDDVQQALDWFFARKISRLDILIDNAGFELLGDLCMVQFLLEQGIINQAVLHVKPCPIFVSDVIEADVYKSIQLLTEQEGKYKRLARFGGQLGRYMSEMKIRIECDPFWAYPLPFWKMPSHLYNDLGSSDFIISKGDANYRRLLGDRRWDYQDPFPKVISYFPSALLAIRIIKSEIGVGYAKGRYTKMVKTDPQWMKDGKWGTFQFWNGEWGEYDLPSTVRNV